MAIAHKNRNLFYHTVIFGVNFCAWVVVGLVLLYSSSFSYPYSILITVIFIVLLYVLYSDYVAIKKKLVCAYDRDKSEDAAAKIMEETLKQSEERFQLAIAGSNNGIWDWNMVTDEAYFSPQFKKMLGFEENEIGSRFEEWSERLHKDDKEPILELLQAHLMAHKGAYDVEYRLKMKSGEYRWFRTKGQAVWDDNGKPLRMAGSLSDISKRKIVEEELLAAKEKAETMAVKLLQANEEAQIARAEAERATQMKTDFLANMSHEIRTPMNGIIGMTSLLLESELVPIQIERLEVIRKSGEALLDIINDILDISKIESGKMTLEPIVFNLQDVMVEVVELLMPRCVDKDIELALNYMPNTPELVVGDQGRIRQILINLIGNAIKFTNAGHVLVNCSRGYDDIENGTDNLKFCFEIIDTGIGIPEEAQQKLFDKFTQADASTTRKYGGTGLGLAICNRLVGMMGGEIGLKSKQGEGSVFWFLVSLPLANTKEIVKPREQRYDVSNARVLVVDEFAINSQIIKEYLTSHKMRCDIAVLNEEVIDLLKEAKNSGDAYEVVLLNHKMPNMDAKSLAYDIKNDEEIKDTILIMITAKAMRGEAKEIEERGFSGYLVRPFHSRVIVDSIAWLLAAKNDGKQLPLITRHTSSDASFIEKRNKIESGKFNANILVAEDNMVNQMMVRQMLELLGCKVDIAENGKEALQKSQQEDYDLILMDCMMPEMNGYEATQAIRKFDSDKKDVAIIALTANALQGEKQKCLDCGMNDYLSKPIRKIDLQKILGKWLKNATKKEEININIPKNKKLSEPIKVIDEQIFNSFIELMGGKSGFVLHKHCEIVRDYLFSINKALNEKKYNAAADAAHPLKSSSRQIGACEVAKLAESIEKIGRKPEPNDFILLDLVRTLEREQGLVEEFINKNFPIRKTA